ncbi:ATPase, AAA-type, core [Penicillium griseofulvum]|uniref:ATPase, AAA-type, core n=1 Tax=Penicillium patulum TaxID=5078 RepID=A0A135LU30_PENPA|nr:ATPase, AAA-type, core [Penicillium griseofulvum]KXG52455.1 ATPase, AAA-type, core [Penicillium griseofulvum]
MDPTSTPVEPKDEVVPDNLNGSAQSTDVKDVKEVKDAVAPASETTPASAPKLCKKHKKKNKKKEESDSSSESSSSSESDSDADSEEESDSESDSNTEKRKRRLRKARAKRALKDKKRRKKKKQRSRKVESSDSESDSPSESDSASSTDSDDEIDDKALRKLVTKLKLSKKRAKKLRELASEDLAASDAVGETRREKRSKRKKPASKVAYKRVDQLWDTTIHKYKLTETVDDPDADEWDQYIFNIRRKFNWENKYLETVVDIKSKPLRDALSKIMDGVKGVSLVQEPAVVDPNMLFLYLEETRQYMKDLKKQSRNEKKKKARKIAATKASHLKVLIKYLDTDYADIKKTLYPLLEANTITFDLLWALYKPNTIAYTPTYGSSDEPRAFKIEYAIKESSFMKGQWYSVDGRYLEYDGKDYGFGTMSAEVDAFKGARKITSLACYPLKYHRDAEALRARLIERGKRFVALRGMNYRFHKGMAFYKKKRSLIIKVNINGRVMIDPAIHRRINPNYPISTVRPKDPDLIDPEDLGVSDNEGDESDGCCCASDSDSEHGGASDTPRTMYKVVEDTDGCPRVVEVEVDENGAEIQKEKMDRIEGAADTKEREFTEEELLVASPVVLGFAFSEKLWLEFTISGISDIEWDKEAFGSLVLPANQKSIVKALVESHTFNAAQNIDDVIQGKGKGLVAVLHGPPGTGKTLTAEGIAELLRRPLYMVSAGELGTDSRTLEAELNKILDIAHSWGAVLLLDEADVFLEKRTIHDIHRNALVSIFLRLLEYFQGILFLTTNRVETFDDAFQSRIHVALRYGDLTSKAKKSIWKMFLERVRAIEGVHIASFSEEDYDMLSRHTLNGRQIKNSVRTAQALAVNENAPLSMEHIKRVLEVAETFDQDLRGGTGYLDAMRSYT